MAANFDNNNLPRVIVIQIDNREISLYAKSKELMIPENLDHKRQLELINRGFTNHYDFWSLSLLVNHLKSQRMGWDYERWQINQTERWPTWNKVRGLIDRLPYKDYDLILFLDSDAWIREEEGLSRILADFWQQDKMLMFAEDPRLPYNTRINTGCIAMRNTYEVLQFWRTIWELPDKDETLRRYCHEWCHEQKVTDEFLKKNNYANAMIVPLQDFNSACGKYVRHCWWKDKVYDMLIDELVSMHVLNYLASSE